MPDPTGSVKSRPVLIQIEDCDLQDISTYIEEQASNSDDFEVAALLQEAADLIRAAAALTDLTPGP